MRPTDTLSRDTAAVADTLAAMIKREEEQLTTSSSHEDGYLDPSDPTMITADDRKKLVDWCYHVVDHCQLSRVTVASAMEMVDRFLSITSISNSADADATTVRAVSDEALRDQSKFQLLTVTALYVAIKVNERVASSSDLFAEMCSQVYTIKEIEDMELVLLSGLSWRCHAPTAHQVGLSILSLILPYVDIPEASWGFLMDEMKYLIELAVLDYYFSTQRTSTVALAAIYNAIGDMRSEGHRERLRAFLSVIVECFDFDHFKQISKVRRRLQSLLLQDDDVDERSLEEGSVGLDDSVKTFRVSNRSSQERDLEGSYISYERDEMG
ncbi:cyclin family protein [Skeletonema marinoi]|uniref:Cyclin family protein n=1 Tax=Skeletonema marinoi TaxID=267567 RepID=A0AAD8XYI2_9STRA|nr:cyclin family protein [Skeletonema marinoi]